MSWFLRNAMIGLLIMWIAVSVGWFVIALSFAGTLEAVLGETPVRAALFFLAPWLVVFALWAATRVRES